MWTDGQEIGEPSPRGKDDTRTASCAAFEPPQRDSVRHFAVRLQLFHRSRYERKISQMLTRPLSAGLECNWDLVLLRVRRVRRQARAAYERRTANARLCPRRVTFICQESGRRLYPSAGAYTEKQPQSHISFIPTHRSGSLGRQ